MTAATTTALTGISNCGRPNESLAHTEMCDSDASPRTTNDKGISFFKWFIDFMSDSQQGG
jgi:hypothetical protein